MFQITFNQEEVCMSKSKKRKSEKRSDYWHLKSAIENIKREIECLMGKEGCEHRLDKLQNQTLPKMEKKLERVRPQFA